MPLPRGSIAITCSRVGRYELVDHVTAAADVITLDNVPFVHRFTRDGANLDVFDTIPRPPVELVKSDFLAVGNRRE